MLLQSNCNLGLAGSFLSPLNIFQHNLTSAEGCSHPDSEGSVLWGTARTFPISTASSWFRDCGPEVYILKDLGVGAWRRNWVGGRIWVPLGTGQMSSHGHWCVGVFTLQDAEWKHFKLRSNQAPYFSAASQRQTLPQASPCAKNG